MLKTIFAAIVTYLATSIDEIPVLFMLYTIGIFVMVECGTLSKITDLF